MSNILWGRFTHNRPFYVCAEILKLQLLVNTCHLPSSHLNYNNDVNVHARNSDCIKQFVNIFR